jgi:hypothetical protein
MLPAKHYQDTSVYSCTVSTIYHIQNELALHGETRILIQCEGSYLLRRREEHMNSSRHNGTGYCRLLVLLADIHKPDATTFIPYPSNQIICYQLGKLAEKSESDQTRFCHMQPSIFYTQDIW